MKGLGSDKFNQEDVARELKRLNLPDSPESCPKCKCKRTTYFEKQTRSADEPMTRFFKCSFPDCRHNWKR